MSEKIIKNLGMAFLLAFFVSVAVMMLTISKMEQGEEWLKDSEIVEVFFESQLPEILGVDAVEKSKTVEKVAEIYISSGGEASPFEYFFYEKYGFEK